MQTPRRRTKLGHGPSNSMTDFGTLGEFFGYLSECRRADYWQKQRLVELGVASTIVIYHGEL